MDSDRLIELCGFKEIKDGLQRGPSNYKVTDEVTNAKISNDKESFFIAFTSSWFYQNFPTVS